MLKIGNGRLFDNQQAVLDLQIVPHRTFIAHRSLHRLSASAQVFWPFRIWLLTLTFFHNGSIYAHTAGVG